jgi:hypothetical protein
LPKRGETVVLTSANWDFLKLAINKYEHANIEFKSGKFYGDGGKEIKSYQFKMTQTHAFNENNKLVYSCHTWLVA